MFTREKKLIALLLSAALVLTMNTGLFAAVGAEDVASVAAATTSPTTPTTPTTPTQDELDREAMVSNNMTHEATIKLASAYDVTYYQYVPFYGKKWKGKDFSKVLGTIVISANGVQYKASKVKVVRLKGKSSASWNAGIAITKLEVLKGTADKKTLKAVTKALKTATKTKAKDSSASMPLRIYPMNLEYAVSGNQVDKPVVKGKADKLNLAFKIANSQQKMKFKNGKKDLNKASTYDIKLDAAKNLVVSSNDIYGTVSADKIDASKVK